MLFSFQALRSYICQVTYLTPLTDGARQPITENSGADINRRKNGIIHTNTAEIPNSSQSSHSSYSLQKNMPCGMQYLRARYFFCHFR